MRSRDRREGWEGWEGSLLLRMPSRMDKKTI